MGEFTVNVVALTPPNVTFVAPVKLVPEIVTTVPTGPLVGVKPVTVGGTTSFFRVLSVAVGVFTVTRAEIASGGTTAVMKVSLTTLKLVAGIDPKSTAVAPLSPVPSMSIVLGDGASKFCTKTKGRNVGLVSL